VAAGYLLEEDLQTVRDQASDRYDLLASDVPVPSTVAR
jgi:hypothetical protein